MIFDKTAMFSQAQSVTATAASTHVIDLGKRTAGLGRDIGKGAGIPILCQVVEQFYGSGGLRVSCEVSDDEAFTAPVEVWRSPDIVASRLKAGFIFTPETVQRGTDKRYMRLKYTAVGALTSGKLTAGITMGNQSNG